MSKKLSIGAVRTRQNHLRARYTAGFSLAELLIVVLIMGILLTITVTSAQSARARARDTERKDTLKRLQVYLELYKDKNGNYPPTGAGQWFTSEPNNNTAVNYNGGDWIPYLAPSYIGALPRDPLGGPSKIIPTCDGWLSSYLYRSDTGADYTILAHCSPETTILDSDPFYDSVRYNHAFKVCTPGGCGL